MGTDVGRGRSITNPVKRTKWEKANIQQGDTRGTTPTRFLSTLKEEETLDGREEQKQGKE